MNEVEQFLKDVVYEVGDMSEEIKPEDAERYKASQQKQLDMWLAGKSEHNTEFNECCPDFSCCQPLLLWSEAQRRVFMEHPELRHELLNMSLGAAIKLALEQSGAEANVVHLASFSDGTETLQ